jgi:predicted DNA-binding transcriptional regulator AlpA
MQKIKPEQREDTEKLVRLKYVLEIIPVSPATWWNGVKSGKFPKGIKLGPKTTCWRLSEIIALAEKGTGESRFKSIAK